MRTASLVKWMICLWDLSRYEGGTTYQDCHRQMRTRRPPPTSPDVVERTLREGVASGAIGFTAGKVDVEFCIQKYREGFVAAFERFQAKSGTNLINYEGLGWGNEEAECLALALKYVAEHCDLEPMDGLYVNISRNPALTTEGVAAVQAAVEGSRVTAQF